MRRSALANPASGRVRGMVPPIIGWLRIMASILVGIYNGIKLVNPNYEGLIAIGGLVAILFEVLIGEWLLFF